MTGAAMARLCGAGVVSSSEAIEDAKAYLESIFDESSGAFKSAFGNNTSSNAWGVDGLKACNIYPQGLECQGPAPNKKTPINFLISQQVTGGGFRYLTSGSTADSYASQDAVRALGSGNFTATPPGHRGRGPHGKLLTPFATRPARRKPPRSR